MSTKLLIRGSKGLAATLLLALFIGGLSFVESPVLQAQGERKPIDVVLAIDSSGSMKWNDPHNLRLTAAKSFIDRLDRTLDRAGVVSWDDDIDFRQPLTSDFNSVKRQIDRINADGETDLDVGLRASVDELEARGRSDAVKAIIFLTDGDGKYTFFRESGSQVNRARALNIRICSIGLGDEPKTDKLSDMAVNTGCLFFRSPTAEALQQIFDRLIEVITRPPGPIPPVQEIRKPTPEESARILQLLEQTVGRAGLQQAIREVQALPPNQAATWSRAPTEVVAIPEQIVPIGGFNTAQSFRVQVLGAPELGGVELPPGQYLVAFGENQNIIILLFIDAAGNLIAQTIIVLPPLPPTPSIGILVIVLSLGSLPIPFNCPPAPTVLPVIWPRGTIVTILWPGFFQLTTTAVGNQIQVQNLSSMLSLLGFGGNILPPWLFLGPGPGFPPQPIIWFPPGFSLYLTNFADTMCMQVTLVGTTLQGNVFIY